VLAITGVALFSASGVNAQTQIEAQKNSFFQEMKTKMQSLKNDFMNNLTDSQKQVLEQAKTLREQGKFEEAKKLIENAGIKMPERAGKGMGHGKEGMGPHGDKKQIEEAIISGNFSTFQNLASTSPLKSITLETFNQLTPHFQAKKAAQDKIREILKTAGVEPPNHEKGLQN
jgi:uncharacterized protein (DUF305 family)